MPELTSTCAKCGGTMEKGFIPDFAYGGVLVGGRDAGAPKKSFFRRTAVSYKAGVPIGALRCGKCGVLELYADQQFAAG